MATTMFRPTSGPSAPTSSRTEAARSNAGARLPIPQAHPPCGDGPTRCEGRLAYHGAMSAAPSHIRPATRGDLPEVVDLLNACDVAEVGEPDTTADDVESDWGMEGFALARDAWVAVGDDEGLVGYAYNGDQFRTGELEADLWVHLSLIHI